jgi:phosphoribosyl 1,2-cyclic phosphodiesterase
MSTSDFKVKFRGTRGSYPTPKAQFLRYGGNTSCVEVNVGGHLIILDAGTGIIDLGRDLTQEYILSGTDIFDRKPITTTLVLSHIHQDHIQGLPFFNPLYNPSTTLNIFGLGHGTENLKQTLASVLFDKVFPLGLEDITCNLDIQNYSEKQAIILSKDTPPRLVKSFELYNAEIGPDDVVITAHKTFAHPKEGCLCIKIAYKDKLIVYATDKESYVGSDKKFVEFAHGADLLIHDAQYTQDEYASPIGPKQGFGHSTFQIALETTKLAKAKRVAFFHYDPNYDDEKLGLLESEFTRLSDLSLFSKENLEIDI